MGADGRFSIYILIAYESKHTVCIAWSGSTNYIMMRNHDRRCLFWSARARINTKHAKINHFSKSNKLLLGIASACRYFTTPFSGHPNPSTVSRIYSTCHNRRQRGFMKHCDMAKEAKKRLHRVDIFHLKVAQNSRWSNSSRYGTTLNN